MYISDYKGKILSEFFIGITRYLISIDTAWNFHFFYSIQIVDIRIGISGFFVKKKNRIFLLKNSESTLINEGLKIAMIGTT